MLLPIFSKIKRSKDISDASIQNKINDFKNSSIKNNNENCLTQINVDFSEINEDDKSFSINFQYIYNKNKIKKINNNEDSNKNIFHINQAQIFNKKLPKLNFNKIKKLQISSPIMKLKVNSINCSLSSINKHSFNSAKNNINKRNNYESFKISNKANRDTHLSAFEIENKQKIILDSYPKKFINNNYLEKINQNEKSRSSSPSTKKVHFKASDRVFGNKFQEFYIDNLKNKKLSVEENKKFQLQQNDNGDKKELNEYFKISKYLANINKYNNIDYYNNYELYKNNKNTKNNKNSGLFLTKMTSSINTNINENFVEMISELKQQTDPNKIEEDKKASPKVEENIKISPKILEMKDKNGNFDNLDKVKKYENNSNINKSIELIRKKFKNIKKPFFDEKANFCPDDTFQVVSKINKLVGKISTNFDEGKSLEQFVKDYQENYKVYNKERHTYKKKSYQ